jgi:NtrC-family two-component system sensor histidine kinase KinB
VHDLLDLSKIEAGRVEMEFETLQVNIPVRKACSVFTKQAEKQQVELACNVPDGLAEVKADPNKITWVLTNLISNALRYTEPGGHIGVAAEELGDFVYLSVADDGAGIPLEYQSRVFDKFVQVKGEKALGGSGLGLAIAREIVKAHGGTIWLHSTPGQGSTFTFTLPAAVHKHSAEVGGVARNEESENLNRG